MPIEVTMPKLSPTMETGVIAQWLVKVGDQVKEGDILADIETDKATMQMKSYDDGIVAHIDHPAGEEVALGQRVLVLAKKGEDPKQVAASFGGGQVLLRRRPKPVRRSSRNPRFPQREAMGLQLRATDEGNRSRPRPLRSRMQAASRRARWPERWPQSEHIDLNRDRAEPDRAAGSSAATSRRFFQVPRRGLPHPRPPRRLHRLRFQLPRGPSAAPSAPAIPPPAQRRPAAAGPPRPRSASLILGCARRSPSA